MAVIAAQTVVPINTSLSSGNITFTKPSGLAVGDLMLACVGHMRIGDIDTPTGWTLIPNTTAAGGGGNDGKSFYKYADSSDVAASSFIFHVTGSDSPTYGGGVLYRLTSAVPTDPLITAVTGSAVDQTTVSISTSLDVVGNNALLIMMVLQSDSTAGGNISGYYITGGTSPTFTERTDYYYTPDDLTIAIADATYTVDTDITAFGWESAASVGAQNGILIMIPTQADATVSNALLQSSPVTFSPLTGSTQTGTINLHESSPNFPEQSGVATVPTAWTPTTKS